LKRVLVLVDGLNLFHALKELDPEKENVDLLGLCQTLVRDPNQVISEIIYFTSITKHLGSKVRDQQAQYLLRLVASGVHVKLGEFRSQSITCSECRSKFWAHQEKRTDVALASELIKQAFTNRCELIYLFSADSDFLPAIEMVHHELTNVEVKVVSTVSYLRPIHGLLVKANARQIRLSPELVARHQFED
jgi:uncharacterized LabA/DUF88 family protein